MSHIRNFKVATKSQELVKRLDGAVIKKPYSYNHLDIVTSNFAGMFSAAAEVQDPDKARLFLYYIFQPMFDSLVDRTVVDSERGKALDSLRKITHIGTQYLVSYYTGEPEPRLIRGLAEELKTSSVSDRTPFKIKFRNVDYNAIFPEDILGFLRAYAEQADLGKVLLPDVVIGAACGASEVAMPLAGIMGAEIHFIRRSHRRGDTSPKVIKEQEEQIKKAVEGKSVVCVEDYVCTGESLSRILKLAKSYGAAELQGVSIRAEHYNGSLRKTNIWEDLKTFELF